MTSPTGSPSRVTRLLLVARVAIAVAVGVACVAVVSASGSPQAGQTRAPVADAVLGGFAMIGVLLGGAIVLLAQIVAGIQTSPRRVAGPGLPSTSLPRRLRQSAVLGSFGVSAVITVVGTVPQPGSVAAAAWLVGLGLVGIVLDTVPSTPAPPDPAAGRRVSADAHASATVSWVFGSLLLVALAVTIADQVLGGTRPATAVPQIVVATLAVTVAFVLAPVLRGVSRSIEGRTLEALRRAIRNLQLVVGAAALTAAAGFVAVVLADAADGRVPTYRAAATVLVLFVAVLNGIGLNRLDRYDSPARHTPNPPGR